MKMEFSKIKQKILRLLSITIVATMGATITSPTFQSNAEENTNVKTINVTDFGADPSGKNDSALAIYNALEEAKKFSEPVIINFPKGEYSIYKDYAQEREYHTSNTNSIENPMKKIGILIEGQKDLTIEGNDSLFVIHGDMMALAVVKSENIKLRNFAWDFEVPTTTEMTVKDIGVENGKNYVDYFIPSNFKYEIVDNNTNILWTSEKSPYTDEYYWTQKGHHNAWSVVIYNPKTEITRRHSLSEGPFNGVRDIKKTSENTVRITYNNNIPVGQTLGVVNEMCASTHRHTAGAFIWESKNTSIENVNVHYMDGFGWLTQMSENVTFDTVNFMPRVGTGKYTTSFADLIHVSGAKGKISIKNSNFSHAHDDPINIHGTFTRVEEKIDNRTLKLKYIHGQQGGFPQYYVGDEVAFFTRDTLESPSREEVLYEVVESSQPGEYGNDLKTMIVKFNKDLPEDINSKIGNQPKYVAENVTYTPELEIVNNVFHTIPTRGILATTRKPVLIEGNTFKNMSMASIFLSNDSNEWYESGPIRDMTIRNNEFHITDTGQTEWADAPAVFIHPVTLGGKLPSSDTPIHKNITIEENEFYMNASRVVTAESVENITIRNNKVFRENPNVTLNLTSPKSELKIGDNLLLDLDANGNVNSGNNREVFSFKACKNVVIEGNSYDDGLIKNAIVRDMPLEYVNNNDSGLTLNGSGQVSPPTSNIKYVTLNPEVIIVDNNGKVNAVGAGTGKVIAYYIWNDTEIKSNEIEFTVLSDEAVKPEEFEIVNGDNEKIEIKDGEIQFEAIVKPESLASSIMWSVKNIDNTATDKATISENGLFTAKKEGFVIVNATLNGISKSRVVRISFSEDEGLSYSFNILNENNEKWESINDTELKITMERGDLYNSDNSAKNIFLYNLPGNIDKDNMRLSVKISNLPLKTNNRWDSVGVYLFKDADNYTSIGKKSHFNGVVSVKETNGSAVENDKNVNVQESTLIFDLYKNNNQLVINYKTPNGNWIEWGTIDATEISNDYKIGFAAWNHDGRATDVNISEFKVANGSEYDKDSIKTLNSIKFTGVSNIEPSVREVNLNKSEAKVSETVSVDYLYSDLEGHNEGDSIYRWQLKNNDNTEDYFTQEKNFVPNSIGKLSCTVYPVDEHGKVGEGVKSNEIFIVNREEIVSNADLEFININNSVIDSFDKDKVNYQYNSISNQESLKLNVKSYEENSNIVITVDGEELIKGLGNISGNIKVNKEKDIIIKVVSPNGENEKVYSINIKKYNNNFSKISSISIPELNLNESGNLNDVYTLSTSYDTKSITLNISSEEIIGNINLYSTEYRNPVNNNLNQHNEFQGTVDLKVGNNTFYVEGVGKDGKTKSKQIINILRTSDSKTELSDIKINGKTIEDFSSDKLKYLIKSNEKPLNIEAVPVGNSNISIKDLAIASKNYNMSIPEYDLNDDGVVGAYEVDYISGKILE